MDSHKLNRELKKQGFKVEPTSSGWLVENPSGQMGSYHESSLDVPHNYANVIAQLKRIGFVDPEIARREKRASRKRAPGHFICADPICGCGRDFPYAQNLGRHLAAVARRKVVPSGPIVDPAHKPQVTRPMPPESVRKLRLALKNLRRTAEGLNEVADLVEGVLVENIEIKRKLGKVEEYFGKALDSL